MRIARFPLGWSLDAVLWTLLVKCGFILGCGIAASARHLLA